MTPHSFRRATDRGRLLDNITLPPAALAGAGWTRRMIRRALSTKGKTTRLDRLNEGLRDFVLHPTKGFRRVSVKRSACAFVVLRMKTGYRGGFSNTNIRAMLLKGNDA